MRQGASTRALALQHERELDREAAQQRGVLPDAVTYNSLIALCAKLQKAVHAQMHAAAKALLTELRSTLNVHMNNFKKSPVYASLVTFIHPLASLCT